ncbi:MAG: hypothetical protein EOS75_31180 [Mesorhizobium sp.]|nr:MAG: hypothetical protein EOS75_31180 [Mesorhizobium sp.]
MTTSKEVNALRQRGKVESAKLDEAYALSLDLVAAPDADDWDRAAYAWCLIDLVKRHAADGNEQRLAEYLGRLKQFGVPAENTLLAEHREKALSLAQFDRRAVLEADKLSRQGRHEEAARIFADLHARGDLRPHDRMSWGWVLYRLTKAELQSSEGDDFSPSTVQRVKRHLNTYLKLGLKGPDLLHSLVLQQAMRLVKGDHLKVLPFVRLWDLNQLSDEDFTGQRGQDGKTYPSLAERAIQSAASEAVDGDRPDDLRFILPHVEAAMMHFPENIWLKLNMAKLLRGLGRIDEARALAISFAREKATEFWVWDLIGDLVPDEVGLRLSCFAKALSCSQDDDFVGKVRLKFAALLAELHPAEARFEVERVLTYRKRAGYRVPREAQAMSESAWFAAASPQSTGRDFYTRFTDEAEALLFSHLPWTDASLGDVFTIEGKDGQKPRRRRRIYVRASPLALELSLPDTHPDVRELAEGMPLLVQYEMSKTEPGRATIHRIRQRPDGTPVDVAPERIGVIDHVNRERSLLHVVVARDIDGTCPISAYPGAAEIGATVAVRLVRQQGRNGARTRIITIAPSDQAPPQNVCRPFREATDVTDKGLGFTLGDIFIPPHIVAAAGIAAGDLVEGTAIISYDKRRAKWGMKAIEARSVAKGWYDFSRDDEDDD